MRKFIDFHKEAYHYLNNISYIKRFCIVFLPIIIMLSLEGNMFFKIAIYTLSYYIVSMLAFLFSKRK